MVLVKKGPYSQSRVYDPVIQALSGATDIQADRDTGRPRMFRIIVADKTTALTAAQAVSSALYAEEYPRYWATYTFINARKYACFFWPEGMAGLVYEDKEFDVRKIQKNTRLNLQS